MARYVADHAFAGFAYRFFNVERDSQFNRARNLMGQYALVPSGIFRDSSLWNDFGDSARSLFVKGEYLGNGYRFSADRAAPYPRELSHQRSAMNLRWLGGGDYAWDLVVDHAVGPVTPGAVAAAIVATLTAAEGRAASEALADARAAFPRTGAHLAGLLSLDSLRTENREGATTVTLGLTFRPDRLREHYPRFAAYVSRYIMPTVYDARLATRDGRTVVDLEGHDGSLVIRLRSRAHRLATLEGNPVPMPDTLQLHANVSMKYGIFRVGFSDLVGDFIIERAPQRRAWSMRFTDEPGWQLPLGIRHLIRSPLRRPFEGRGIEFILAVRGDLGPQTLSVRHTRITVNESAIMRWLGRLGASAFGEFTGPTEREENRFLYGMFAALREDISRW